MKRLMLTAGIAAAFMAGFYSGRLSYFDEKTAESLNYEPAPVYNLADQNISTKTAVKKADILPDDLYVRVKKESENKPAEKQPIPQPGQLIFVQKPDPAAEAHRNAAIGIQELNAGRCSTAADYLRKAFDVKKDRNFLSHLLLAYISCGKTDEAVQVVLANPFYTDDALLADIIETAVKNGNQTSAATFFEFIGRTANARLVNAGGIAFEASGDTEKAIKLYKLAYSEESSDPFIIFSRARAADLEQDYVYAVDLYEDTIKTANSNDLKRYAITRSAQIKEHLRILTK